MEQNGFGLVGGVVVSPNADGTAPITPEKSGAKSAAATPKSTTKKRKMKDRTPDPEKGEGSGVTKEDDSGEEV